MSSKRLFVASWALIAVFVAACGSDNGDEADTAGSPANASEVPAEVTAICVRPVPPLTGNPVTKERLESTIQKMGEVQQAAEAGNGVAASTAFAGDTHAVTHDIDQPLRAADPALAQDLCASIVIIEQEFGRVADLEAVAAAAASSVQLLQQSGARLGLTQ
jgi:hypothetical protein